MNKIKLIRIFLVNSFFSLFFFNFINISKNENNYYLNIEDKKINNQTIINDINEFKNYFKNRRIKFHVKNSQYGLEEWIANSGAFYSKWSLKKYNAFDGINDLEINWNTLINEIGDLNKLDNFGNQNINEIFFFDNLRTETKINLDESLIKHENLLIKYNWYTDIFGKLEQINSTINQIGGKYNIAHLSSKSLTNDNLFQMHCIGDINGLHTHDGGWAMAGSHHNYELESNNYNTEVFVNQNINLNIFNETNVKLIFDNFIEWNFPTKDNPNNISGIWNKNDLINNGYSSVIKFSNDLLYLKIIRLIKEIMDELKIDQKLYRNKNLNLFINNLKDKKILNPNYNDYTIEDLSILYERIIAFFSNVSILANINNEDYILWDGNNFNNNFKFFDDINQKNNELNITIKNINIQNLKNYNYGVITPLDTNIEINSNYILKYRNNFHEINEILYKENYYLNSIKINSINKRILDLINTNEDKISSISNNDLSLIKNEINKNFNNLFSDFYLFDYERDNQKFVNINKVLKEFNLYENRFNVNINPTSKSIENNILFPNGLLNNNDGIFYLIGKIKNWKNAELFKNNYEGNFSINAKTNFIQNINRKNLIISELINNEKNDTTGYLFIQASINPNYLIYANDFIKILENYNRIFIENYILENKSDFFNENIINNFNLSINYDFCNDPSNNYLFYDMNIENKKIKKYIWNLIEKNPNIIFDYKNLIFNHNNLKYIEDINEQTTIIEKEILQIKNKIQSETYSIAYFKYWNILIIIITPILLFLALFIFYKHKKNMNTNN